MPMRWQPRWSDSCYGPELIEKMGLANQHIAEERFDVRKINQVILQEMGICE
jgi:hypothetical protein